MRRAIATFSLWALIISVSLQVLEADQSLPHSEIAAVAKLQSKSNNSFSLIVEIKNISDSSDVYLDEDFCCKILVKDDQGNWKPLRPLPDPRTISRAASFTIKPGKSVSYPIDLTPEELSLVTSRSTKCQVRFSDKLTEGNIETSPEELSVKNSN